MSRSSAGDLRDARRALRSIRTGSHRAGASSVTKSIVTKGSVGERSVTKAQQRCLAMAMYWEARGEGPGGMTAVGWTVLNRVRSGRFPTSPCAVVHQGGERWPCEFEFWCDGKSDRPREADSWQSAMTIAAQLLHDPPATRHAVCCTFMVAAFACATTFVRGESAGTSSTGKSALARSQTLFAILCIPKDLRADTPTLCRSLPRSTAGPLLLCRFSIWRYSPS